MVKDVVDLEALPLRFNPPDGWRQPDPVFISLYQAHQFPSDWSPYPGSPAIPAHWPWWEENGTSWYRFFRDRAPLPARSLGNWFSLAALGLFSIVISPFALPGWWISLGGITGLVLLIVGIRGVTRTARRQSTVPGDPFDIIREWAATRRQAYLSDAYSAARQHSGEEFTLDEFHNRLLATWWGENPVTAEN